MSDALPPYPAAGGPGAASRLRRRLKTIDGLIKSLEGAEDHLERSFTAGLAVADQRNTTNERLRRLAGGR